MAKKFSVTVFNATGAGRKTRRFINRDDAIQYVETLPDVLWESDRIRYEIQGY